MAKRVTMVCKRAALLIVDDDKEIRDLVCEELAGEGYVCDVASDADDALAKLKTQNFDMALLDIKLPGMSGIDLLKAIGKSYQTTAVVIMTAVNDIDTAVEAMKLGASDYIVKPFTFDKLNASIGTVLENRKPQRMACDTILSSGADYGKNVKRRSLSEIDAIAYGINAQVDCFDTHSKTVTERAVELARWLGLPEKEIEKWAVARDKLYSDRDGRIKSMLSKLEKSPMAQVILGLTHSVRHFPECGGEQN